MRKKKIFLISAIALICIVLAPVLVLVFRTPSAAKIFEKASISVVELKAQDGEDIISYGTAELISKTGEFITNAHVVTYTKMGATTEFKEYFIRFTFETEYRAVELIKYDLALDLAVLKLKKTPKIKLKPIPIGNSSKLKSGDKIYAVGNSQNFGIGISQGIIGIPLIEIEYSEQNRKVIQCDITIAEGNSGGALLDRNGKLIGITTFRTKDSKGNVIYGLAYCVPVDIALEFIDV